MQLEDRSPERRARARELATARQRRHRQKQKRQAANRAVTRHAAVTRDGGVTGVTESVTVTPESDDSQRETVTRQNQIENQKKIKEPPSVPQRGTERGLGIDDLKAWINTLFGRQGAWSYEETQLLSELLPISKEDRGLLSWAYKLPRDNEGWALVDHKRSSKPKQNLISLLREFSSEIDKWRSVRSNHDAPLESAPTDEWTPDRRAAFERLFSTADPGPFYLLGSDIRRRIDAEVKESADRLRPEWNSMIKKIYGSDVSIPPFKSQLAPSVRDEIEAALKEEAGNKKCS
jgi:hypothetical protein